MSNSDEDQLTLLDRLRYSAPGKPTADAHPRPYYCTYCYRVVHLLPQEFCLCQTRTCLQQAIVHREQGIFELQLSVPRLQAQLLAEKAALLAKIDELEVQDPHCVALRQYKAVLSSLNANLGFNVKNECVDRIVALHEQIRELSKRLARPSFSDEFRRNLWERDGRTCYLCHKEILDWDGSTMHIDHVRPRSQGGSDEVHNLRIAHPMCNLRKGDRALSAPRLKAILKELGRSEQEEVKFKLF